jgi:NADP-dependent 3-hydroxy acid dehydrogenase YdfG
VDVTEASTSKFICGEAEVVLTVSTERTIFAKTGAVYCGSIIFVLSFSQEYRKIVLSRAIRTRN